MTCPRQHLRLGAAACLVLLACGHAAAQEPTQLPVVLWHGESFAAGCSTVQHHSQMALLLSWTDHLYWAGMGDSCCNTHSIGAIQAYIEQQLPGAQAELPWRHSPWASWQD